jgi:hypothetical protein
MVGAGQDQEPEGAEVVDLRIGEHAGTRPNYRSAVWRVR